MLTALPRKRKIQPAKLFAGVGYLLFSYFLFQRHLLEIRTAFPNTVGYFDSWDDLTFLLYPGLAIQAAFWYGIICIVMIFSVKRLHVRLILLHGILLIAWSWLDERSANPLISNAIALINWSFFCWILLRRDQLKQKIGLGEEILDLQQV